MVGFGEMKERKERMNDFFFFFSFCLFFSLFSLSVLIFFFLLFLLPTKDNSDCKMFEFKTFCWGKKLLYFKNKEIFLIRGTRNLFLVLLLLLLPTSQLSFFFKLNRYLNLVNVKILEGYLLKLNLVEVLKLFIGN